MEQDPWGSGQPYGRLGAWWALTEVRDAAELRAKETDRIAGVVAGLRALGAECEATSDGLVVHGATRLRGAMLDAGADHRLAMAWAIAAALVAPDGEASVIDGDDAAVVSYPGFFDHLERLTTQ
jgi:3-phosphoshikimate 1-carboxyvinyltransferase